MSPKIKILCLGKNGHAKKIRNHRNDGFEGSQITKSKSYKFKLEQNNTTEFLSKLPPNRKKCQTCWFFSNDVVLNSLCPPRKWSGAGVGIKIMRGAGGSLT